MWSIIDLQTGRIMETGRNSQSKEETIRDLWRYWVNGTDFGTDEFPIEEKEEMDNWPIEKKADFLKTTGFSFFEHNEHINHE